MTLSELLLSIRGVEYEEHNNESLRHFHCCVFFFVGIGSQIADGKTFYNADTRC
jgi:hypothetical protein